MKSKILEVFSKIMNSGKNKHYHIRYSNNFQDQLIRQKGHLIHKLKAKDSTGKWAYYFVWVEPNQESEFMSAIEGDGMIDLEDYGSVIASSYGEEPTPKIIDYLSRMYGFDVTNREATKASSN